MSAERIALVVGAVVAVLLQVLVAPHIALLGAVPDFIVAYALACAVVRPNEYGSIMPFVLGLAYDLFTGGPVGAMALSLTVFSMAAARAFAALDNDTLFMPLAVLVAGVFLVELSYGALLLLFGYNAGLADALAYRIVPCFAYDLVIALALYPLARRFLSPGVTVQPDITQIR